MLIRDYTKFKSNFIQPFNHFWFQHPGLHYGIAFLIGVYASFQFNGLLLLIICLYWLPLLVFPLSKKTVTNTLLTAGLAFSAFFYASNNVSHPSILDQGIQGRAFFTISTLTHQDTFMGKSWNFHGKILHFQPKDSSFSSIWNIPTTVLLPDKELTRRPLADGIYLIEGNLKKTKNDRYIFHPKKNKPWNHLSESWGIAEWRFKAKQSVNQYIKKKYSKEPVRSFLAGIATGEFENRLLSFEFSRFGLQHIMAISGFHFSIVAGILGYFLSCCLGKRVALLALMILMSLYFIFLGPGPSILRAWISCMIAFSAFLLEKQASGLNSLGVGLLTVLIFDPEMARSIGFQFSFVITAAILLLYHPMEGCLKTILPTRSLSRVIKMNNLNQHGFIVLILFRQALALTIAVNLAAAPITLYYFQKFPLMSILYNFFFPWMVSISMLLLIFGLTLDMISDYAGNFFHHANQLFTQFVLDYTYSMPRSIDINLHVSLNLEMVIFSLVICFICGILLRNKYNELMPINVF